MIKTSKRAAENSDGGQPMKRKLIKGNGKKIDNRAAKTGGIKNAPKGANKFGKNTKPFNTKVGNNNAAKDKSMPHKAAGGKPMAGKFNNKFAGKKPGAKNVPNAAPAEKTDWRKFKQEKKELKLKRKQSKDSYEVSTEAKQIYEKLKCRRTEDKQKLVEKLYNLLNRGDIIKKLIMAHDTARIIQCMLKHASPALRDQLSEKLLPLSVDMAVSKYSHFCVLRMFKYGSPPIKSKLVDSFIGNIVRLAGHNISSKILDHVYHTVASSKQRAYMRQEFYGELYRSSKDDSIKELADAYKETPNMKMSILGAVKSNLEHIANKQLADNSLVHAVMLEYLRACDEDKMEETITMLTPMIPLMLTTKDGSQAAIICFYKSTPKNRRAIIKTIKEHLVKICTHEHGHIFMVALLNSLDDTKATKKAIYDTIHPELETLMSSQWGRRVIEWLVAPADTNCFHPTFIAEIDDGLQYGKKDKELRRKEIFEQIEEPLTTSIAGHPQFWLSERHIALVTAEILKKVSQDNFVKAATALAEVIIDPAWAVNVEEESKDKKKKDAHDVEKIIAEATKLKKQKQKAAKIQVGEEEQDKSEDDQNIENKEEETKCIAMPGIEEAGLHIVLKKIIKNDKERLTQDANAQTFGSLVVDKLTEDTLTYWISVNRACFVLLNIVEQNNDATKSALKELLKPHQAALKKQITTGAKLLLKKLQF